MIVGIGIDLIEVPRLAEVLQRQGEAFLQRVFTAGERAYCEGAPRHAAARLAARWAAKEALLKALGTGLREVKWQEIEVVRDELGAPALLLHGAAAEVAQRRGVVRTHLSLTHTEGYAAAQVVLEGG